MLALGVAEGPRVGTLLREVRRWWLDGGCIATPDACRAELSQASGPRGAGERMLARCGGVTAG